VSSGDEGAGCGEKPEWRRPVGGLGKRRAPQVYEAESPLVCGAAIYNKHKI
jgi:hypothetical protein